jgi:hypothetical protein
VWNPVRQLFFAAVRYHGYYQSPDGETWTRLADQPGTGLSLAACPTAPGTTGNASCPIFRGALAVQPTTGDTFALTVDSNNLDQGLWQDVCALSGTNCTSSIVTFAKRLNSTPLEVGNGSTVIAQGDYNFSLAAVSSGPSGSSQDTLLYAGTIDLYRCSLNSGCVLRNTTNAVNGCAAPAQVAPAQHAIATLASTSQPLLYLGNDGGLWRSTDGVNQSGTPCSASDAAHFQNLNSGIGSLAEVVSFAQHPSDPATLLVGLGANGTAATAAASSLTTVWPQLSTGEGGTVAIDQSNPLLWYVSTAAGVSVRQCTEGSACTSAGRARRVADRRSLAARSGAHLEHCDRHLPGVAWPGCKWCTVVVLERYQQPTWRPAERSLRQHQSRGAIPGRGRSCKHGYGRAERWLAGALRGHGRKPRRRRQLRRTSLCHRERKHRNQHNGVDRSDSVARHQ